MSINAETAVCSGVCPCASPCPIGESLKVVGGKWKMRIICTLFADGTQRYNDLVRKTKGITNAMLSSSLKELEADGLILRKEYPQVPPKVEYSLSELGSSLMPVMDALCRWGYEHIPNGWKE